MLNIFKNQPRPFRMIFMLEVWERFGYYTVQGILALFLIRFLGFTDSESYFVLGAFTALVYSMVAIGGYLGDHVLGTKRTIALGLATLACGYLALSLFDKEHIFYALGLICVGNGLFKANPANLLSKCYEPNDPRLHTSFTLYYFAVNLGSAVALLAGPSVAHLFGYSYAYFLSFIGLIIGNANYWYHRRTIQNIHTPADDKPIAIWQWGLIFIGIIFVTCVSAYLIQHVYLARRILWFICAIVLLIYLSYMRFQDKISVIRMFIALILMLEGILFFVLYQQMPTSLNIFAVNHVRPSLLGIAIDPQSFQALNPIWIISLSPFLAALYQKLHRQGITFAIPFKFAVGMLCCGLSFTLLYFSQFMHDANYMVSSGWLIMSYLLQSLGELLVSALGVAMVAELVPRHITGFVMGMWFLTSSIAGFIGASVASLTSLPTNLHTGMESLSLYANVFASIGGVTLLIGLLMMVLAVPLSRYIPEYIQKHTD